MEARGEIRGGRFVAGFVGEQFALPEAVDLLRSLRDVEAHGRDGDAVRDGSAEPRGHPFAGRARTRAAGQPGHLPRWRAGERGGEVARRLVHTPRRTARTCRLTREWCGHTEPVEGREPPMRVVSYAFN